MRSKVSLTPKLVWTTPKLTLMTLKLRLTTLKRQLIQQTRLWLTPKTTLLTKLKRTPKLRLTKPKSKQTPTTKQWLTHKPSKLRLKRTLALPKKLWTWPTRTLILHKHMPIRHNKLRTRRKLTLIPRNKPRLTPKRRLIMHNKLRTRLIRLWRTPKTTLLTKRWLTPKLRQRRHNKLRTRHKWRLITHNKLRTRLTLIWLRHNKPQMPTRTLLPRHNKLRTRLTLIWLRHKKLLRPPKQRWTQHNKQLTRLRQRLTLMPKTSRTPKQTWTTCHMKRHHVKVTVITKVISQMPTRWLVTRRNNWHTLLILTKPQRLLVRVKSHNQSSYLTVVRQMQRSQQLKQSQRLTTPVQALPTATKLLTFQSQWRRHNNKNCHVTLCNWLTHTVQRLVLTQLRGQRWWHKQLSTTQLSVTTMVLLPTNWTGRVLTTTTVFTQVRQPFTTTPLRLATTLTTWTAQLHHKTSQHHNWIWLTVGTLLITNTRWLVWRLPFTTWFHVCCLQTQVLTGDTELHSCVKLKT